jgi:ABC-type bacteriocin/lantibiotic exporter with double-glycine peptidase domain
MKQRPAWYALLVVFSILLVGIYKLTVYYTYRGKGVLAEASTTHYGGIQTGELHEFIQTRKESCGQAAAAFFLTTIGIPESEASLIEQLGTAGMVSLADIEQVFRGKGFNTQSVKVAPEYFRNRPVPGILHFTEAHFVVFIREEQGNPMLFDPAYGLVYVSWDIVNTLFSGYMVYVYKG